MRFPLFASLVAIACAGAAGAQTLLCPTVSTAPASCEMFHFHAQMFRPDTRGFIEVIGANQFSSQAACDRARDASLKRNAAVADFFHHVRNDDRYQPDRFGPCHCDMTVVPGSPNFLGDAQRAAQLKLAEDLRQRVRERLLDADLPSDNVLVRSLSASEPPAPMLGGPRLAPLPAAPPSQSVALSASDLRMTTTVDSSAPAAASLDLPLVDVPIPGVAATIDAPAPTPAVSTVDVTAPATPQPPPTPQPSPQPAPQPQPAQPAETATAQPAPQPAPPAPLPTVTVQADEPAPAPAPPDDAADAFVSVEMQRIQNVLSAGGSIADESLRSKVIEACIQRTQVLSNLRSLIEGSGAKSRLATVARAAREEPERLALVSKLFGSDVPAHWAPKDAGDVVIDTSGDPAAAEQILRDTNGKYDDQKKRHALYLLLARTQPTEEQQLWLGSVIDALLQ